MKFDNTYRELPEHFYALSKPASFPKAKLIALNKEMAQIVAPELLNLSDLELAQIFSGQKQLAGSHFISLAYAGHQFGHFVPSLGDGRAILLGEVVGQDQRRYDLQLKGAGPTHFSRRGDGMSALGPVIREYIVSEAMHHLGVPSTRALAAVATGENVQREEIIPGGVFTRIASSHLRIGTFEYFASRGDVDALKRLVKYSLRRHYPNASGENQALTLLQSVLEAQINLVSKWMGLGFIHGVMNTDNMSISGETIDFGPCAFMDHFNYNQVYSYIDRQGRYSYINQSNILVWNLSRLADCLIPLVDEDEKTAINILNTELAQIHPKFKARFQKTILLKLGFSSEAKGEMEKLISLWLDYLHTNKIDFTLGFRNLNQLINGEMSFYPDSPTFQEFVTLWKSFGPDINLMNATNPIYIPRNHQVERAIQAALKEDYSVFREMNELLKHPYTEQKGFEQYTLPPNEAEKVQNTFCGT